MNSTALNQQKSFDILVVDHTSANLKLLAELLSVQGYHVRQASSGELALRSIKAAMPDLILLDVKMTGLDGYEVCRRLKADESTADIPIIFISAFDDETSKVTGFEVGGADFISKPFRKEEVLARVKTHLDLHLLQREQKTRNQLLEEEVLIRKIAESELAESVERFRTTLYSIGDGVITTDEEGRVQLMNTLAEKLTGWKQEEASGKMLEEIFCIINEETLQPVEIPIRKVLREGLVVGLANHTLLIAKDGTQRPITDSGAPIKNDKGKITGVVLVFQDQTEERKAEHVLRESEYFFRESQKAGNIGSFKYELVLGDWQSSEVLDEILGLEPKNKRTFNEWLELIHPDDREMMGHYFAEEVIEKRLPFNKEYRVIRKSDGETLYVQGQAKQLYNDHDQLIAIIGTIQDISERKRSEDAIKQSEAKFRGLFEHATIGFSMTMPGGEININTAFANMLGYEPEELKKISWKEITHPDDIQVSMDVVELLLSGKQDWFRYEKRYIHKTGAIVWTELSTTLLRDEKGEPLYFITNINDLTKRKLTEEKLLRSEQELKKAQQITHIGSWYLDVETNEVVWSEELYKMYGFDPTLPPPPYTEHMKLFTTESWELLSASLARTAETGIPYELELKTVKKDGDNGWMWVRGESIQDANGKIIGLWGAAQDITERKKAEEALRESEEKYHKLFALFRLLSDTMPDMLWAKDLNQHYIFTNKAFCENLLNAVDTQEPIGKTDIYFAKRERDSHPDNPNWHTFGEICMDTDTITLKEMKEMQFDEYGNVQGKFIFLDVHKAPLFNANGELIGVVGSAHDITERKQIEEDIKKERTLLRSLIDNLPINVYVKDIEGRKLISNKADIDFIGKSSEEEVVGKTDVELFSGENGQHGYDVDMEIMKTKIPVLNLEESFYDNHGEKRWLVTSKIPLCDSADKVFGLVGTGRDITMQHHDHETIHKLTKSIEQSPSTIIITSLNGDIEYVNPKFTEITGYTFAEAIGKNPRILKSGEMPAEKYNELWNIISTGGVWRGEFHNRKKNGELYWEWATMTSIKDEQGEIINYIAIKEDISLRKQMESDLILAKEKAEENDRLKTAFLANMSHEIRTPLNCILGFTELITDPDIETVERLEYSKLIGDSGNNLLSIINDILDISKIESGQVHIKRSKFPIQQIIKEVVNQFENRATEQGILLRVDPTLFKKDIMIESDDSKLKQVLINFVTNALKFTEKGSIEIGIENGGDSLQLYVRDTGIGISKEFHTNIFERFRQVETSHTRKYGGNGLGLAISKSLIELLGGTIGMESEQGKGSLFYVKLPVVMS